MKEIVFKDVNELVIFADGMFYGAKEDFWYEAGRNLFVGVGCYLFERSLDISPETIVSPVTIKQCLSPTNCFDIEGILKVKNLPDETRRYLTGFLVNSEKVQASVNAALINILSDSL